MKITAFYCIMMGGGGGEMPDRSKSRSTVKEMVAWDSVNFIQSSVNG